jgi:hypothetical protein
MASPIPDGTTAIGTGSVVHVDAHADAAWVGR